MFTTTRDEVRQTEWNRCTASDRIKLLVSANKAFLSASLSWNQLPPSTAAALMALHDWTEALSGPSQQDKAAGAAARLQQRARSLRQNGYPLAAEALDAMSREYRTLTGIQEA